MLSCRRLSLSAEAMGKQDKEEVYVSHDDHDEKYDGGGDHDHDPQHLP